MVISLSNVYLLRGKEVFLKQQYLKKIKDKFESGSDWINSETYFADEHNISNITTNTSLFPSENQYRLSIVKNIDKIPKESKKQLLHFVKNIPNQSVIVFVTSNDDGGGKFINKLGRLKNSKQIVCKPLKGKQLYNWVKKTVSKKSNKDITHRAVNILLEKTETDLLNLNNEIEKLILYSKDESEIDVGHVEELIKRNVQHNVFVLIDYICAKDIEKSMQILKQMFTYNVAVVKLVGALAWQLKRMLRGRLYLDEGCPSYQITKNLGINRYFADKFISQIKKFKLEVLESAIKELSWIDAKIKRSDIPKELLLENFVIKLINC